MDQESPERARDESFSIGSCFEGFAALARRHGIAVAPYGPSGLATHFEAMESRRKSAIGSAFQTYASICRELDEQGKSLWDDRVFLASVLRRFGLRPCDDLFESLTSGDVVEVYSSEGIQIFRNFNFFEITSYSLDEIIGCEWWKLFKRDPFITKREGDFALRLFSGHFDRTVPKPIEPHVVEESFGPDRITARIEPRFASPLYDPTGGIKGGVNVFRVLSVQKQRAAIA